MEAVAVKPRATVRLFAVYAVASLLPVLALGFVLAATFRREANARGLAEGRAEAGLVARTALEPLLDAHAPLRWLTRQQRAALQRLTNGALGRDFLRLRVRDPSGRVLFSPDASGRTARPDDEALDAAKGKVVARLTRLNADSNDTGSAGVESVEVYLPLRAARVGRAQGHRAVVGVLELYLPYAPIRRDVTAGLAKLYRQLGIGLALLYVVLFGLTASVSRRLRNAASVNAFLAERDVLTSLPNRILFRRRVDAAVEAAGGRGGSVALAIIDLDRFKQINDTLGHHSGDQLLVAVARRLESELGPDDLVARLGGDEFGVLISGAGRADGVLRRLRAVVDEQTDIAGVPLSVEASIGYAVAPEHGKQAAVLLQRADVAMYAAKSLHRGVVRYDEAHDHYDAETLALGGELRQAINAGQLIVHYQPLTVLQGYAVKALECLVRWQHPHLGLLPPGRFLPLAEQTDLIEKLTQTVLETAIRDIQSLPGSQDIAVAVNVSARSVVRPEFADEVIELLERLNHPPGRLTVEVTETTLLVNPERAVVVLGRLAEAGVRISLDDFGAGQTSLGYLSRLPLHELKIDRSFVGDMTHRPAHAAIVRSLAELGHNLGLQVVAEGIETPEVLAAVREAGVDIAQGFLLARPMAISALRRWLAAHAARAGGSGRSTALLRS